MIGRINEMLVHAQKEGYAIGAFNIYNVEGVRAVVQAAERLNSPVILQVLPKALTYAGIGLVAYCLKAAQLANVPIGVQLDHCSDASLIKEALDAGVTAVMADGSVKPFSENVAFTKEMADLAHEVGASIEGELGRISGTEDGITVETWEASLTNVEDAVMFVQQTGADALAVCIGNVHGLYKGTPRLDFDRLREIQQAVTVPLVLHGTSGLPDEMIREAVQSGVCKFNVNTELRRSFVTAVRMRLLASPDSDLIPLLEHAIESMRLVVEEKITLFGSKNKAR